MQSVAAPRKPRVVVSTIRYGVAESPVGRLFVAESSRGLCGLYLLASDDPTPGLDRVRRDIPGALFDRDDTLAQRLIPRVVSYLVDGRSCDDLPLDLRGTPFQIQVWNALREVPHGSTLTYAELARAVGLPGTAARAVGTACGRNPISLIVPCHRIVASSGGLGGYYWGLELKQALLDLEQGRTDTNDPRLTKAGRAGQA